MSILNPHLGFYFRDLAENSAPDRSQMSVKKNRLATEVFVLLLGIILWATEVQLAIAATDLVVDGTTMTLAGEQVFDHVTILNGGVLFVEPFNGTPGTGILKIIANSIVVDATSSINADGRGYRGVINQSGEGPGGGEGGMTVLDGGGGGGYGGKGGRGVIDFADESGPFDGDGGAAYGSPGPSDIDLGSAGGSAGTGDEFEFPNAGFGGMGGNGGGAIVLVAETITIGGTLTARGQDGQVFVNDASGGGAGGGILIDGGMLTISGTLRADGGHGGTTCGEPPCDLDDGGGGGGGGRIKLLFDTLAFNGNISVSGGFGARTAERGDDGSVFPFELQPQVVNDLISFVPLSGTFQTSSNTNGCPAGFVGTFRFSARLTNQSSSPPLTSLLVQVITLTNGNLLGNAEDGPGGVGARLSVPRGGGFLDGVLEPNESVDVPFIMCLTNRNRFTFFVDVAGIVSDGDDS